MTRYCLERSIYGVMESDDGWLVSYQQAQAEIDERDEKITSLVSTIEGLVSAIQANWKRENRGEPVGPAIDAARRALASKEIVSRAKKHAAENAGEMADCAVAVESIY